ncbi:transcriptional regulator [Paraburkholderia caballeronis]|uniref:Helix-turn-helix domain-containing protein n=1 Tax=Paraburkholderia caballeronis TaxID=416943 RepID=A0A1H7KZK1_9BURK|nr:YdaS family helix-turn-helix protein [Paraburkholderia caballeronis]PXW28233.1 hypothetical protein C7403_102125 [Paraburkholderia caballeronis]PXX03599.1 hypothetical protein C7407_102125 [Paraburkholderia caballeronis]RAK04343.1 hypothetical protein C7409_102125 [Paraburkholderia caballeronis]SED84034.1 hypothetical protein SAMN05445871_4054 [Paraburkholderia caballeronis]SEK92219.1 hypothetical protein SAMN05192542_104125 [Paraburkholderia caballeronis]
MDTLRTYLNSLPVAEQAAFARRCNTSLGYLRKALSMRSLLGEKLCALLDRESGGAVPRQDLRPDWRQIWPELAQESLPPCTPDVGAAEAA